jgi:hypothetical protein
MHLPIHPAAALWPTIRVKTFSSPANPQPHNPYHPVTVILAQPPTPAETKQLNENGSDPSNTTQVLALTGNTRPVIQRIIDILFDLILPLFLQISGSMKEDQLVQKATAKLEVALKKKATLDMSQDLKDSLTKERIVAHKIWNILRRSRFLKKNMVQMEAFA